MIRISESGLTARIQWKVALDFYKMWKPLININMSVNNHTLDEIKDAVGEISLVIEKLKKYASSIVEKDINTDGWQQ